MARLTRALSALLASPRSTGEWSEQSVTALRELIRGRQAALLLASESEQRVFGDQSAGAALRQLPGVRAPGSDGADRARVQRPTAIASSPGGAGSAPRPTDQPNVAFHLAGTELIEAVGVVSGIDDRQTVGVYCTFVEPVPRRVAEARLRLLDAVRPALEAAARERLVRRAELGTVRRTLHAFESAAALFTADGTLLDANNAAVSLLASENGDGHLQRSMVQAALSARSSDAVTDAVEVRAGFRAFRLRACPLGGTIPGDRTVLVLVDPAPAVGSTPSLVPDVELLRERFHLTEREQEVARLLCLGQSNVAIAEALGISPNTARHHTERVLMKLDIRSRAAIHRVLLETQRDMGSAPPPADRREAGIVALPRGVGYRSGTYGANGSHISRAD